VIPEKIKWPDGKQFAFTVFDDTDEGTVENVGGVYSFLRDSGFRTTKSCWLVAGDPNQGTHPGQTCEDPDCLNWLLELQAQGFEIAWHNCTWHSLPREQIAAALEQFHTHFGHDPLSGTNHCQEEGIYWGESRLTGARAWLYSLLTRFRNYRKYRGHIEGDPYFWGDLCRQKIKYYRNFVFQDINTLKACPIMPYHDPLRPYVNYWFASSDGNRLPRFNECVAEAAQDRLEAEGGACIMYTHFACGFYQNGKLEPRFQQLMTRLSQKNGWFVPVATLLDYLLAANRQHQMTDRERRHLERKWLWNKVFLGAD
jgi:hypothetical protein